MRGRHTLGIPGDVPPPAQAPEGAADAGQNHAIDEADEDQERRRHARPDQASQLPVSPRDIEHAGRGERDEGGRDDDDGGVTEREPETDGDRSLALLHQLARDVVDRRDVIRIDAVPHPEDIGQERRREQGRVAGEEIVRPGPDRDVRGNQEQVQHADLPPHRAGQVRVGRTGGGQEFTPVGRPGHGSPSSRQGHRFHTGRLSARGRGLPRDGGGDPSDEASSARISRSTRGQARDPVAMPGRISGGITRSRAFSQHS